MSKARLHIETLAAFSTPTVKPSLRPGSLSLQQVKKLPTAPQRKHNGGMHTHTHIRKHTAENRSPTGYAYSPGCCLSHRLPTMLHPGESMCERKKRRREGIIHGVRGKKTIRRERGQEKAKRENEGVSLGTERRKINTMETEDGESGKENARNRRRRAVSMKTGLGVIFNLVFPFRRARDIPGEGWERHTRCRLLASRPAARLRCSGCSLGLNKSHI